MTQKITPQMVGAAGEKLVEAKLLRRGWLPANANASVRNAAVFDIHAEKNRQVVSLRVKTCGPGLEAFQFSDKIIKDDRVGSRDYTILVAMGKDEEERSAEEKDQFYIVPTRLVRDEVKARKDHYINIPKRDGSARKAEIQYKLRLFGLKSGKQPPGYDLAKKWKKFLNNWKILEKDL